MLRTLLLLAVATISQAFVLTRPAAAPLRRAPPPQANLFETLGKIAECACRPDRTAHLALTATAHYLPHSSAQCNRSARSPRSSGLSCRSLTARPRRRSPPSAVQPTPPGCALPDNKKYFSTAAAGLFDSRTARASHILFGYAKYPSEEGVAKAADLKAAIESGEITFEDAAKEFSTCPSAARGGDLGTFKRGAMVPEFDAVCFDEDVPFGAVTGPVKTQFGHHLIQVVERAAKS